MEQKRRVIALGFFDGVHLGHGALLRAVTAKAKELNATPSAMSFDVHPSALLAAHPIPLLNANEDRVWLMRHVYGIEDVILAHFDEKMMHQPWEEFVTDYLAGELGAVYVVAGCDFRFGDRGAGDAQRLREKCAQLGIGCEIVGMVELDGQQIHSTLIRDLITAGEMEQANRYLGHPHMLTNRVGQGKHLGRILGFPTVNLQFQPGVLVPARGVYATKVYVERQCYIAVTNVGVRPTVEDTQQVNVEAFLLDFSGDLYGKELRVEFYRHLRGERKFPSVEALRDEVMRNAQQTRDYFAAQE
ncbi:MAG: riboflavin biosynthesis protein RibF [Clostridiales bacterium]|nr:riboflavin biosynthesis protein RibF [Clostridiales bacterium]